MWAANFFSLQLDQARLFGPSGFFSPHLSPRQVYKGWLVRNELETHMKHRRR